MFDADNRELFCASDIVQWAVCHPKSERLAKFFQLQCRGVVVVVLLLLLVGDYGLLT